MYLVNVNGIKIRKNEVVSYTRANIRASRGFAKIKEEFKTKKGELCIKITVYKGGRLLGVGACKLNTKTPLTNTTIFNAERLAESRALGKKEEEKYRLESLCRIERHIFVINGREVEDGDIILYENMFYSYKKSFSDEFTLYKLELDNYRDNHLKNNYYDSLIVCNKIKDKLIYTGNNIKTANSYIGETILAINTK